MRTAIVKNQQVIEELAIAQVEKRGGK